MKKQKNKSIQSRRNTNHLIFLLFSSTMLCAEKNELTTYSSIGYYQQGNNGTNFNNQNTNLLNQGGGKPSSLLDQSITQDSSLESLQSNNTLEISIDPYALTAEVSDTNGFDSQVDSSKTTQQLITGNVPISSSAEQIGSQYPLSYKNNYQQGSCQQSIPLSNQTQTPFYGNVQNSSPTTSSPYNTTYISPPTQSQYQLTSPPYSQQYPAANTQQTYSQQYPAGSTQQYPAANTQQNYSQQYSTGNTQQYPSVNTVQPFLNGNLQSNVATNVNSQYPAYYQSVQQVQPQYQAPLCNNTMYPQSSLPNINQQPILNNNGLNNRGPFDNQYNVSNSANKKPDTAPMSDRLYETNTLQSIQTLINQLSKNQALIKSTIDKILTMLITGPYGKSNQIIPTTGFASSLGTTTINLANQINQIPRQSDFYVSIAGLINFVHQPPIIKQMQPVLQGKIQSLYLSAAQQTPIQANGSSNIDAIISNQLISLKKQLNDNSTYVNGCAILTKLLQANLQGAQSSTVMMLFDLIVRAGNKLPWLGPLTNLSAATTIGFGNPRYFVAFSMMIFTILNNPMNTSMIDQLTIINPKYVTQLKSFGDKLSRKGLAGAGNEDERVLSYYQTIDENLKNGATYLAGIKLLQNLLSPNNTQSIKTNKITTGTAQYIVALVELAYTKIDWGGIPNPNDLKNIDFNKACQQLLAILNRNANFTRLLTSNQKTNLVQKLQAATKYIQSKGLAIK